jgi:uncharacterized membrane protein
MDAENPASVEKQLEELRSRVFRLEEILRSHGAPVSGSTGTAASTNPPDHIQPNAPPFLTPAPVKDPIPGHLPPPAPSPSLGYREARKEDDKRSLESRVGSQWFNRIGILAILIGMAWFLKLAIDNHWIGPVGRILTGLLSGTALIVWSERFRTKGYTAFSYSLKAAGSGILYLSLWASFSLYHLLPSGIVFSAMIAVTAWNAFLSWRQNAELLALYAIVGGLGTPVLVSTGQNHETALFCYLLMIDLAALVLVTLRPWSRLLFCAFSGTVVYIVGWWVSYYTPAEIGQTAWFLGCFFLVFALAPLLSRLELSANGSVGSWDLLAIGLLPLANAGLGFIAFYELLEPATAEKIGPWLAVTFSAFYLGLLRLPQARLQRNLPLLSSVHLSAAVVFLTIALPLKAQGRWLTIGWLVEGASLLWTAKRVGSRLLGVLSLLGILLGLLALFVVNPGASTTPFFNGRFVSYAAAIAVFAFIAWLASSVSPNDPGKALFPWPAMAATALLLVNLLLLIAVSAEIHSYWLLRRLPNDFRLLHEHEIYEQFSYSAFLMAFGALLLAIGFWRRSPFFRWQALVLLSVSVAKVFLVDVSTLSQGFRVLSFLGLGVLLLGVSFVYQRDWLNLRSRGGQIS